MVKETDGTLQPAIVVTGASSGIGRDIARLAARDRCFLLLLGRSQQALDQLVAELAAAGSQAAALSVDLLDPRAPDCIESALSEAEKCPRGQSRSPDPARLRNTCAHGAKPGHP